MIYYIIILSLVIASNFLFVKKNGKTLAIKKDLNFDKYVGVILVVLFVAIATFRSVQIGTDTETYKSIYDYYSYNNLDIFFSILFRFGDALNLDFSVMLFVSSVLTYLFVGIAIYKHSCNSLVSFILYLTLGLYAKSLNMIRQMLAAAILMISLGSLKNNNFWKFSLCVIFASLCHISAIVFFLVYPFRNVKFGWKIVIPSVIIGSIFVLSLPSVVKFVSTMTGVDYYSRYFVGSMFAGVQLFRSTNIIAVVTFILFLCLRSRFETMFPEEKGFFNTLLNIYYFYLFILIVSVFLPSATVIGRLATYFYFSIIFIIPMLLRLVVSDWIYIIQNGIFIVCLIMFYVSTSIQKANNIVPYTNVFNMGIVNTVFVVLALVSGIVIIRLSYEQNTLNRVRKNYGTKI